MGYRKTLCVDARAGRRQEKGDAMRNHPEDARGFGRVGQIVPRVMKEIDRRCDLRHRLRAEWGREPSDVELVAMTRATGGIPLEAATPSLRKYELEQYLASHGWPWNPCVSLDLDHLTQLIEAQNEPG